MIDDRFYCFDKTKLMSFQNLSLYLIWGGLNHMKEYNHVLYCFCQSCNYSCLLITLVIYDNDAYKISGDERFISMYENYEDQFSDSQGEITCTRRNLLKLALIAIISAIWLFLRTARKPSRIIYPCQQVAIANIQTFRLAIIASLSTCSRLASLRRFAQPAFVGILLTSSFFFALEPATLLVDSPIAPVENLRIPLNLESYSALSSENTSEIFVIQNASGYEGNMDSAITALFRLMETQELQFYQNESQPDGLIASDDVILLKVNCQWPSRGGTSTDLAKSLITAITNHPSGFTGEIVIADNGQGRGDLNWTRTNSFYRNQSMADLVACFPSYKISTQLWDDLREFTVNDYDAEDTNDGYVRSTEWNSDTQLIVSYPKWQTPFGTYISFKQGIWNTETGFNSERLKVINLPVLKSHSVYGVTGCIKHYMGVPQGHIVASVDPTIPHEHFSIALGGLGTLMAETRIPVLNILDCTWINANPIESGIISCGPATAYYYASFTDIICASRDPVALDYYASKNILMATAIYNNHTDYSSLDPDYESIASPYLDESFHNYLNRSMNELSKAGFKVTMNQEEMDVYVEILPAMTPFPSQSTTTSTQPTDTDGLQFLGLLILLPVSSFVIVIIAIVFVKRKNSPVTS